MRITYRKTSFRLIAIIVACLALGVATSSFVYIAMTKIAPNMLQTASAADQVPTDEIYFTFESETGKITNYDNTNGPSDVVIPSTIGGVTVTAIDSPVYDSESDTVDGSFYNKGLTSVVIPNSVTSIGPNAFQENPLISVTIGTTDYSGPAELTISENFFSMPTLTSVAIGNNVKVIQNGAFQQTSIASLTIPSSVTTIRDYAFSSNKITDLFIPDTVTEMSGGVFSSSTELKTLQVGTTDYEGAPTLNLASIFFDTHNIESITLGNSVKSLTSNIFSDLPNLTSLDLGDSIEVISGYVFCGLGITELFIPDSVKQIDGGSFNYNHNLTSIVFGTEDYSGTPTVILDSAFYDSSAIESIIINGVVKELAGSFYGVPNLTHLEIGESVDAIIGSFYNNKLTDLFIPNSVKQIDNGAFGASNELRTLIFGTEDYSGTPTIELNSSFFPKPTKLETLIINSGVRVIGAGLSDTPALTTLDIRGSVEQITNSALSNNKLSHITFPNSVEYVGSGAFSNSSLLRTMTFGDSSYIGAPNLVIGGGAFSNTFGIEDLEFHNNLKEIQGGAFVGNKITKLDLPESLETIQPGAFWDNRITEITVAGPVSIDAMSFGENNDNTGEYARLYTKDPTNPYGHQDLIDDNFSYIVNPAALQIHYSDSSGNNVAPTEFKTGVSLTDYTLASNPDADFGQYYRGGDTITLAAGPLSGYTTPQSQTLPLIAGLNIASFIYTVESESGGGDAGNPSLIPGAPNTGVPPAAVNGTLWALLSAALALTGAATYRKARS